MCGQIKEGKWEKKRARCIDRATELGEEKQRWASFVSAEARATVEDLNRLDRELYAYALARYEVGFSCLLLPLQLYIFSKSIEIQTTTP